MTSEAPADWVIGWFEYRRRSSGTREERKALELGQPADVQAARNWVDARVTRGGVQAVQVIVDLAEAVSTQDEEAAVGIGPIEDLIYQHSDASIPPLLDAARRSPALARSLGWMSLASGSVSEESLSLLSAYRSNQ